MKKKKILSEAELENIVGGIEPAHEACRVLGQYIAALPLCRWCENRAPGKRLSLLNDMGSYVLFMVLIEPVGSVVGDFIYYTGSFIGALFGFGQKHSDESQANNLANG